MCDKAAPRLQKRGGYSGSKPGSAMKPPPHRPSVVLGKASQQSSSNGSSQGTDKK
jgi:hypothetical protein